MAATIIRRFNKKTLIAARVSGQSFVDIGGLWGTTGEMITTAHAAGASRVTMADIQPLSHRLWKRMDAHCGEHGLADYARRQIDICAPDAPAKLGKHDFVHCSGIMYHVPDLFSFVSNLAEVTNRYLMIGSVVMPKRIDSKNGVLQFPPDTARLMPILTPGNKAIVRDYLESAGLKVGSFDGKEIALIENGRARTGPWWWLFSGAFLGNFVRMYGLRIIAEGRTGRSAYTVLAEKV